MALTTNIVSSWKFDESSGNAADATGNGHTLTNVNSATYVAGKINNCVKFISTSSQKMTGTNGGLYDVTSGTLNAWVFLNQLPSAAAHGFDIFSTNLNSNAEGVEFVIESDNHLYGMLGAGNNAAISSTTFTTSTWYNIAFVWTPLGKTLYVNGTQVGTNATAETLTSGSTLYVGDTLNLGRYTNMQVDDMSFWSRALTATEITQLYNGGAGLQYPFVTVNSEAFLNFF